MQTKIRLSFDELPPDTHLVGLLFLPFFRRIFFDPYELAGATRFPVAPLEGALQCFGSHRQTGTRLEGRREDVFACLPVAGSLVDSWPWL